ncbi:MAG TPA: phage tail protein [Pyrinomonadaceae bacterium]|jgi:phage tail-like protein|nr:phage tail protein [Pyrinomonadaceae bacterium]
MAKDDTKPAAATYIDPYRAYNFKLIIDGVNEGHFTEVSGMEASVAPIPYREAGNSQVVHYVPGRTEYGAVTLRYGVTQSKDLWNWFLKSVQGKVDRKNVSIVLLDSDGATEVTRWDLLNAWPTQWRGAMLDTRSQEVAIETVTLVCETLVRA